MKQLSREAFARARAYLAAQARPLEQALLAHRFEGAPAEAVTAELVYFRNDDGGFGHALDPDLRLPASSALATADALHLLAELGCPAEHPLVRGAVQCLRAAYDEGAGVWRVVPPEANASPHAPWWHDDGASLARTFDGYRVIPRTRIVALLLHYAALVEPRWLEALAARTVREIIAMRPADLGGGGDAFRFTMELAEAPRLPAQLRERLLPWLRDVVVPALVVRDPARWSDYVAAPLKLAPTPWSHAAPAMWDDLQRNLDYEVGRQAPEGYWEPNWTWGDSFPEVWPLARQDWRGRLTLEALTTLRAYGRIEE